MSTAGIERAARIVRIGAAMLQAVDDYVDAKHRFRWGKDQETERLMQTRGLSKFDATYQASQSPAVLEAVSDAKFYVAEATMYGTVLQALKANG